MTAAYAYNVLLKHDLDRCTGEYSLRFDKIHAAYS